jgi:micrococcal nuclease
MEKTVYLYHGQVERVVDGDTVDLTVDFGFLRYEKEVRLRIVGPEGQWFDAYELYRGEDEERLKGQQARTRMAQMLPEGIMVVIRTFKTNARGNFGRWLAAVWPRGVEKDVATVLVEEGLAYFDRKATGG